MGQKARASERIRLRVSGTVLSVPETPAPVRVVDASFNGCGVEIASPLPIGEQVVIEIASLEPVQARVAWNLGGRAGLEFDRPLAWKAMFYLRLQAMLHHGSRVIEPDGYEGLESISVQLPAAV